MLMAKGVTTSKTFKLVRQVEPVDLKETEGIVIFGPAKGVIDATKQLSTA